MSVFSKFRDFLHRHRNKFIVTGVLFTGTFFLLRYAQRRLRDWQEREAKEILERTRKQQHFESTERTCNQTIINLSGALKKSLTKILNTDDIVDTLRGNPDNKVDLWEKLKIQTFTRACTAIYLQVMLVITLRIQLNVLGGCLYKDPSLISTELQEKYLVICHSLLNGGVQNISEIIEKELIKILRPISLSRQLKLNDIENIFYALQTSMVTSNNNPILNFKEHLITTGNKTNNNTPNGNEFFNTMIQDTIDLLDSDEIKNLANHCVNRGFALLSDGISEYYLPPQKVMELPEGAPFVHPSDIQKPMAKLIPIINGLVGKNTFFDQLTEQLVLNAKVKTLGANIYECFCSTK
ncbi:peroxisomal biogenesis factor 3 [Onthophagus taurus]|uniref:peroxisomal biogenesis factor 3 n=1 Tax=Onthophagus taurus TaxID=166361 RepID=UPI000C1FE85A|nr:peroxisomal biogenesis factor 3 [Onthophagus taurus]